MNSQSALHTCLAALLLSAPILPGAEPATAPLLHLTAPSDYQVYQRGTRTEGRIFVDGTWDSQAAATGTLEARLLGEGLPDTWRKLRSTDIATGKFRASLPAPAGGWYRLELRVTTNGTTHGEAAVDHVGVGEVFLIAGQSNSANHGEEKQQPKSDLVSAGHNGTWQPAHDPQPGASGGGGSFIPAFGDAMVERFKVPVGIIATGVGATSVREWLPSGIPFPNPPTLTGNVTKLPDETWQSNGALFDRLTERMKQAGPHGFRAVLWHQGESDANQSDPTRTLPGALYENMLGLIIHQADREVGRKVPWFVAQASYHTPDDAGSPDIRAAQAALWKSGLALQGPDTDVMTGPLRERDGKGVHFSAAGLQAHGVAWADKVSPWLEGQLNKPQPLRVFILSGQSNMEGQGVVSLNDPKNYNGGKGNLEWSMQNSASKERMRHLKDANANWIVRDDVEISFKAHDQVRKGPLTIGYTGYGGSSHIGPELQFGHVVGDFFSEPVLLIKTAWGGKSLQTDFRPPSADGETGPYYTQMLSEVREALAAISDHDFVLGGFVWMQGWNDMISPAATAEYEANLIHLAADIRAEFDAPTLPIVIGELGNGGPAEEGDNMAIFRAAQERGAAKIPGARFVRTHQFARPAELSPNPSHGHHWSGNAESYFLIGDALGEAMIDLQGE